MDDEKLINLNDVIALLQVPEISEALFYTIEKYKTGEFARKFQEYRQRQRLFKESAFNIFADTERRIYWFELVQVKPGDWVRFNIEPTPPPYYDKSEILPDDIIELIVESEVTPEEMVKCQRMLSAKENIYYDVYYVRFSPYYICGAVEENRRSMTHRHSKEDFSGNERLDSMYKTLFYYMQKYPEIKEHVTREFFGKMMPVIKELETQERSILL